MPNLYPEIAFGPAALERQRRAGSYVNYGAQLEPGRTADDRDPPLDTRRGAFVRAADFFFLATVTPGGWPYIQHRGGPKGFVHVLDSSTIGFADFSGNQQYVTTGNLEHNPRVAMFFVDYPLRQRLKLFGRARVIERDDDPDLLERLLAIGSSTIRSRAERSILITVDGYDWNCSRHIHPRYDKQRLDEALALERADAARRAEQYTETIEALRAENAALKARLEASCGVTERVIP
ncbi:pyridoxamine 5'-phosphate oxidase family protein [Nocardia transvalensis]|uniref:pyridoxamine 5'-phosphate oxidase family protein n=1 Tax=Nocardia transvalensis TaxID=37333 RepID=UPI0018937882|nr:pyridoxamine 5'-phosphate oxidase family protein [Nocardia transvalensis]MBF6327364.1 pyridoxamine 5'-phosphate oxidase family protein [Nocardia transvalensis]